MKNGAVVLGVFILACLIIGAFVISLYGREKPQDPDMTSVNARIDSIADKMTSLEQKINELSGTLERNLESIREHDRNIREFREQLAEADSGTGSMASKSAPDEGGDKTERVLAKSHFGKLEQIEEEVKRLIKEENKVTKQKSNVEGAKKWVDWQTAQLRKKLDDEFSRLAEKIGLDARQELNVKDIAGEMLRKITTLWSNWEERLATATNEDWGEFKGEINQVYENTSTQMQEHVSEEQARAIMGFFQQSSK